ncbi:LysR family transcriptional regulator [Actinacidiphila sp. DG2A-62]|uniref:LysR family transcriptional regulator n=1 Tax=Actinacidiphila sp. DG2A-62 TaxID=3108821 RepID=UPI002DBFE071|nr:LysR family transcriptional regulator [Actinacidiphila sp. DG2A-62]MEC3992425.1 LysR family transcriptional regulator [Actinacidiphila sp. DG2A-62]
MDWGADGGDARRADEGKTGTGEGSWAACEATAGPPGRQEPTVHQLRLLLTLAEELHFGRAAARLYMTQPSLSRQLRALEQRIGVELFDRTSRKVEPTAACRALLPDVAAAVRAMDRLRSSVESRSREPARLIVGSLGAVASLPHNRALLRELRARHPRIDVQVRTLNFADHIGHLLDGTVDVVLLRPPVPPGVQTLHLSTDPRLACLPADDPLARRERIALADLTGRVFADLPPEVPRAWRDFWAVDPRPDGVPVRYGPVVSDMESLLHVVSAGEAIVFLPANARTFYPRPDVRYVDVVDLPPSTTALAWTAASRERPAVEAVRRVAAELGPVTTGV